MTLWFAALLGIVQGLTEFLPISSTAHLRIVPALLGQADPGAAFSAVIQLGTLLALLVYFARDLFIDMPRAMFRRDGSENARLPWLLALGTIPIVAAGLSLKDYITGDLRSLWVVGGSLIVVGVLMAVVDRRAKIARGMADLGWRDAALIGAAQALALIPGVSRSGSTIVMALVLGMRRSDAARFSFLLGIPAIAGAGIFELREAVAVLGEGAVMPILVGTATAFISGYAAIAWLISFLGRRSLVPFAAYRVAAGVILLTLVGIRVIAP